MRSTALLCSSGLATLFCQLTACGQWSGAGDGGVATVVGAGVGTGTQPNDTASNHPGNSNAAAVLGDATSPNHTTVPVASMPGGASAQGNANTLRFLGRMEADVRLWTWPGNGVEASFVGTGGSARLQTNDGTNFVGVSIDGNAAVRVPISGAATVPFGPLPQGNHTVRLSKLNESYQGTFTFKDLTVDGELVPRPPPARRLEFVGASMTLGYGIDGTPPCTNGPDKENATEAFSSLTAATLDADLSIVAIAGYGLVRNAPGGSNSVFLQDFYRRTVATDSKSVWPFPADQEPDAVVVNVGTNDFANGGRSALDQNAFRSAYTAFAKTLRQLHPKAAIVLTSSPMLTDSTAEKQHTSLLDALRAVQQQTGDVRLFVLDFPVQPGAFACDNHPSRAQHQAMSALLGAELKKDLGW